MAHNKRLGKKTALNERVLRVTNGDTTFSFNELLEIDKSISIYHKNVQTLAIELDKISNKISSTTLLKQEQHLITCVTKLILK